MNNEAFIVSSVRTAVGKANKGSLANTRPEQMGAAVVRAALERVAGLSDADVGDVILGCAFPEGEQGMNIARMVARRAGLPDAVPGATVNRFCASGLQAIAQASHAVAAGQADVIVAGGVESMSLVPMAGFHFSPDPALVRDQPDSYVSMGVTAENVAHGFGISREDQDAFALRSHQRAVAAIESGVFAAEIVPLHLTETRFVDGSPSEIERDFAADEGPRRDTTADALARLRPAFHAKGTVTAGNSSQMSDGAAAAVVMSRRMVERTGVLPMAVLRGYAVAGVAPELMGIGPVQAIPRVLAQCGLDLPDIDLIELNEAFASQSLAVVRELGLDLDRVNVNGGAIALGHPLGCTGAKLTASLLHEMQRRQVRYGICTMCVGGGMGAAGVFERIP